MKHSIKKGVPLAGVIVAGAALAVGATAGGGSVPARDQAPPAEHVGVAQAAGSSVTQHITGAKPTPQLPMTTVVTPCQGEGLRVGSQLAWPS